MNKKKILAIYFSYIYVHMGEKYQRNNHKKDYKWLTTNEVQRREREKYTSRRKPCIIRYGRKYAHSCTNALAGVDHLASL
jgi:phage protein U